MSQVSTNTNNVKATWIAALPQWYLASIGVTNSVHPYWRFATQAMQMTPMVNCVQGFANTERVGLPALEFVFTSSPLHFRSVLSSYAVGKAPGGAVLGGDTE